MKCAKCENEWRPTGLGGANPFECPRCTYEQEKSEDFRAFRRQVLLALVNSGLFNQYPMEQNVDCEKLWHHADRIARAEPKD